MLLNIRKFALSTLLLAGCQLNSPQGTQTKQQNIVAATPTSTPAQLTEIGESTALTVGNKILFTGGQYAESNGAVDIYVPGTRSWSNASLSHPRNSMAAVAIGNSGYFIGGTSAAATQFDTIDIYRGASDSWDVDQLQIARSGPVGSAIGDVLLVAAGFSTSDPAAARTMELIDTRNGDKRLVNLSRPRIYTAISVIGTRAYISGGYPCVFSYDPSCAPSNTIDVYDLATDTLSTISMPNGRAEHKSVAVGNRLFIGGGGAFISLSQSLDVLDTTTGAWTSFTVPALGNMSTTQVGNYVVFAGGNGAHPSVVLYDLTNDTIQNGDMLTNRYNFGVAVLGNLAYFSGGISWTTMMGLRDIEVFDASNGTWSVLQNP